MIQPAGGLRSGSPITQWSICSVVRARSAHHAVSMFKCPLMHCRTSDMALARVPWAAGCGCPLLPIQGNSSFETEIVLFPKSSPCWSANRALASLPFASWTSILPSFLSVGLAICRSSLQRTWWLLANTLASLLLWPFSVRSLYDHRKAQLN